MRGLAALAILSGTLMVASDSMHAADDVSGEASCNNQVDAAATGGSSELPLRESSASPSGSSSKPPLGAALKDRGGPATIRFPIGLTRRGTRIWCLCEPDALNVKSKKQRIVIVAGLDGSPDSVEAALTMWERLTTNPDRPTAIACLPIANPDRWATGRGPEELSSGTVTTGYPPEGTVYNSPTQAEAHAIWRFLGWFAPDVVEEIHDDQTAEWQRVLAGEIRPERGWPDDSLAFALRTAPVAGIATVRALRTVVPTSGDDGSTPVAHRAAAALYRSAGQAEVDETYRSPLRRAVLARLDRSPIEVAEQLAAHYGDHLDTVMYQPALTLVARLRLGALTGDASHLGDVERIVSRYVDQGVPTLAENVSGSHLAGHLVFAELERITGKPEYGRLLRRAADYGFNEQGHPRETMPFHNEMSDAVFMGCPILTAAGRISGDDRYVEVAARHHGFMQRLCRRPDDLYRHSPLCDAAWGRGNGFPALGLALCLSDLVTMRDKSPAAAELGPLMQASLQRHLRALLAHQDVTGMWHQVIDDPGSYRELTATCMITYAIVHGIRSGWVDADEFAPAAVRAWEAIKIRVGPDGVLFDVCTGTGKQQTLQDYRDRTAILGRDERGGAMALMAAVEMAAWQREREAGEP